MSVKAMSWVWEHSRAKGTDRLVLLSLADHAGHDGGDAWPSVQRLAERCGVSVRTVQGALSKLVEMGEIEVDRQAGPKGVNRYRLTLTPPQILHPADLAPPQILHPTPATSAPLPPQDLHPTPADLAPEPSRTVMEPSENRPSLAPSVAAVDPFDEFWHLYPRHEGKGQARKAWARALKRASVDEILAGTVRYRDDPNRDPAFTAHASTWLNGDRWTDDPLPARGTGSSRADQSRSSITRFAAKARAFEQAQASRALPAGGGR